MFKKTLSVEVNIAGSLGQRFYCFLEF